MLWTMAGIIQAALKDGFSNEQLLILEDMEKDFKDEKDK